MFSFYHNNFLFYKRKIIMKLYNIRTFRTHFVSFGIKQENFDYVFGSIGESESEDPTLTETLARRLS